jgi:hypothetical protein
MIERICLLIEQDHTWDGIAKILDISRRVLFNWRDPNCDTYQPKLAEAIAATKEKMSCNETKAGQHRQSQFHHLKKVVRERMLIDVRTKSSKTKRPPPPMPPTSFRKAEIILYADEFLDLELDPKFTVNEMRIECARRIDELTLEVMVKTKEEITETAPNAQAVKNVLTNCGPQAGRWNFGQDHVVDVSDPLKNLLGEIAVKSDPVPCEEEHE